MVVELEVLADAVQVVAVEDNQKWFEGAVEDLTTKSWRTAVHRYAGHGLLTEHGVPKLKEV